MSEITYNHKLRNGPGGEMQCNCGESFTTHLAVCKR